MPSGARILSRTVSSQEPFPEPRHDLTQQVVAEVRVLVLARGRDGHARPVESRQSLLHGRPRVHLRVVVGVLALEAGLVGEEPADGHVLDGAERVGDGGELRQVSDERVVEAQQPSVAQLQDRHGGEELRDGGDAKQRVGVGSPAGVEVGEAAARAPGEAVARHRRRPPHPAGGRPGRRCGSRASRRSATASIGLLLAAVRRRERVGAPFVVRFVVLLVLPHPRSWRPPVGRFVRAVFCAPRAVAHKEGAAGAAVYSGLPRRPRLSGGASAGP